MLNRLILMGVLVAAIACGKGSTPTTATLSTTPSAATVSIVPGSRTLTTTAFNPNPVVVARGGSVTWVNNDTIPHTSTATSIMNAWDSGNIVPGGSVSIQGRNFSPGGTVTFTIDGHSATVASHSSTAHHLPPTHDLASLSLSGLAPQMAQTLSAGTSVPVKSDGTFEATIQVDPHWSVGSSHLLAATEQSSGQQARLTLVVPRQAELVSCSSSTRTTNIALGPVLAGGHAYAPCHCAYDRSSHPFDGGLGVDRGDEE